MRTYYFTAVLDRVPCCRETDALYGVFDDGHFGIDRGVARVEFHRDAETMEEALRTALADIARGGLCCVRVEIGPEDLRLSGIRN